MHIIIGAACAEKLVIKNIVPKHIDSLLEKLKEMNVKMSVKKDSVIIKESKNIKATEIITLVYPGFPTDLQQVLASLMVKADGVSSIEETIWENRFLNLYELGKMGAKIEVNGSKAFITGPSKLRGTEVNATDLRAGAGLIVAALEADGKTVINNADYILRGYENILRGYENIVDKLKNVNADIELV